MRREESETPHLLETASEERTSATIRSDLQSERMLRSRISASEIESLPLLALEDEEEGGGSWLCFADPGGSPLNQSLQSGPADLDQFFGVAIPLLGALATLHSGRILHCDLCPENIFLAADGSVIFLRYGTARQVGRDLSAGVRSTQFHGDLRFASPEQTGRINRSVDNRSDLYSIGVVLYRLATGALPFESGDPLELIHAQIARKPQPPTSIHPDLPEPISDIILKALEKNPQDRYQSAVGILADIQRCHDRWERGEFLDRFELGENDHSGRLRVPETLYGREDEVMRLTESFSSVAESGSRLLFVAGYSGVGKTRLINEVQRPVAERSGYFITGKFDQFKRTTPFNGLQQALRELLHHVLSEPPDRVAMWKDRALDAVGSVGELVCELVPEMERLIGAQPPAPDLPPEQNRLRLSRLLRRLIQTFARPEHPLVVFLDDMQWADSATLAWIEEVILSREIDHLLIIGAYRDNEVGPSHPLSLLIAESDRARIAVESMMLRPLERSSVREMVQDTLARYDDAIGPLSDIVFDRTEGNPFFVVQAMQTLHDRGDVRFNPKSLTWDIDTESARDADISDNIVEVVASRISRIPAECQDLLGICSCLGSTFDRTTLSAVTEEPPERIEELLQDALDEGLIAETRIWNESDGKRWRFLHDRIQQAANGHLSERERTATHLHVGRILLDGCDDLATDDRLFEIVGHLNAARDRITADAEREQLVEANILAARQARRSAAYQQSLDYAEMALGAMKPAERNTPSERLADLWADSAECRHQLGDQDMAEELFGRALEASPDEVTRASVYERMIHFLSNLRRFEEAYRIARTATALFGYRLPAKFTPPLFAKDLATVAVRMRGREIASLIDLPEMTDPTQKIIVRLLSACAKAAYQIRPELCVAIATKIVKDALRYGNTRDAVIGYLAHGVIFRGAIMRQYDAGYQFAELCRAMIDRYNNQLQKSEVYFVTGYFGSSWSRDATVAEGLWKTALESGLELGDHFHAGCACAATVQSMLMRGVPLEEVNSLAERYQDLLEEIGNNEALGGVMAVHQTIANLRGATTDSTSLSSDGFDEEEFAATLESYGSRHIAHFYFIDKALALYLRGEYQQADRLIRESTPFAKHSVGMLHHCEAEFLRALSAMAAGRSAGTNGSDRDSRTLRRRVTARRLLRKACRRYRKLQERVPRNFADRYSVLRAERFHATGKIDRALTEFNRAASLADEHEHPQVAAIAHRRIAELQHEIDLPAMASHFQREASIRLERWGATDLAADHNAHTNGVSGGVGSTGVSANLDLTTLTRASETLFGEVRLEPLLRSLLQLVQENAGAEKAALLSINGDRLSLIAESSKSDEEFRFIEEGTDVDPGQLPLAVINYVANSGSVLVTDNAMEHPDYQRDRAVVERRIRSVLAAPLIRQGRTTGLIYVENNLVNGAFSDDRLALLKLLSGQIAISIDNAMLYERLEEKVRERTVEIEREKERSQSLLLNILPGDVARELIDNGRTSARSYGAVSILFTDFVDFTPASAELDPDELVMTLDRCFRGIDEIVARRGLEKIKTIGDSYMCAGGIPTANQTHAVDAVLAGLEIQAFLKREEFWPCRIGIHTGPVVTGVVGKKKFAYDMWGDSVNIASRLESSSEPGMVNISGTTHDLVRDLFVTKARGEVAIKGRGTIPMYYVQRLMPEYSADEIGYTPNDKLQYTRLAGQA